MTQPSDCRILVADDDPAILDAISLVLEDEGYQVHTTPDGNKVLSLNGQLPDLILLDIWMSGVDGRDICLHLKSQAKTRDIPIILISANRDTAEISAQVGADDYVCKPFDIDDLLSKVRLYLDNI